MLFIYAVLPSAERAQVWAEIAEHLTALISAFWSKPERRRPHFCAPRRHHKYFLIVGCDMSDDGLMIANFVDKTKNICAKFAERLLKTRDFTCSMRFVSTHLAAKTPAAKQYIWKE